jgi:hypothetical protein
MCAEEVIALADTALYRAKALGRNQGVGLLPSDAAIASPGSIDLEELQDADSTLTRLVRTICPDPEAAVGAKLEAADGADKSAV